ncbi:sialate O-acetylesterase [Candidatus Laterigemmans baculatus]|uniref:sialate O-acetylesterase n=1 Tax=Candidatus Laterigemmans baculatus TaxID=2770505 RepID=UPI0013D9BCD1|nr:sialate O-acetylesterase [Candidatus Laterigemmans baculatus]
MLQRFRHIAAAVLITSLLAAPASADVQLPNVFSSSMVLQQKQQNKVWGKAEPGEAVTVTIDSQTHQAKADDQGRWHVMLEPLKVGGPYTLVVQGNNKVQFDDVLVGEVWVCSGQSNMAWTVDRSTNPDLERLAAHYPQIRMINFPQVGSQEPIWTHDVQWQVCSPETVGNFSAVGYFFARQLHETLDVPVGMINNAWGGSAAEAWVDRKTLAEDGRFDGLMERWKSMEDRYAELSGRDDLDANQKKELTNLMRAMGGNQRPANIYNGVLESHLGYGIRGAIWYQGESNAGRAYQYRDLFPLMISRWREEWGQGDFPFYWVQLADFRAETAEPQESDWAELREAQTMTMDKLPHTGEAVIIDIGEGKDIHPRNKYDVALRLARWALANQYGIEIPFQSPRFKSMEIEGSKAILSFDHVGPGWRPFDVPQPRGFAIAGEDRKFVWADAKILPDGRIEVSSSEVSEPVAVRYGWADNPVVNMYSQTDLPLTPFRTDDWDGVTKGKQ